MKFKGKRWKKHWKKKSYEMWRKKSQYIGNFLMQCSKGQGRRIQILFF